MIVRHKETGFIYGMKVMEKKKIREEDFGRQIARELSIQLYLSHRNVAPLYGYFDDSRNVYLLMELCMGGHLLHELKEKKKLGEKSVSSIMKQVC
jgi:serine/threonine protein kinase